MTSDHLRCYQMTQDLAVSGVRNKVKLHRKNIEHGNPHLSLQSRCLEPSKMQAVQVSVKASVAARPSACGARPALPVRGVACQAKTGDASAEKVKRCVIYA